MRQPIAPAGEEVGPTLRLPPRSNEAEQAVLGALLQDNGALPAVAGLVTAGSFFSDAHRLIFGAIEKLVSDGQTADAIGVFEHLRDAGLVDRTGGLPYLNSLELGVTGSRKAALHARIVADKFVDREIISALDEASTIAWKGEATVEARLDQINAALQRAELARKGPSTHRVPLLRLDALRQASESVRWLVKHVLPAESVGLLFGGSGTFKSFIALDAALHVAHGLPWMGRKTKEGPALYIAAEGGAGLWSRIDGWHRQRRLGANAAPFYVVPTAVDLSTEAWRVVDAAKAVGITPAIVVVDTLSQTFSGEENSANEMAAYLRELGNRFRQLWKCTVLVVHHSGHNATERPRGSSAIRANVDFMLGVHRDDKEMIATLSCGKQKDGELFHDATFNLNVCELGTDEDGDRVTSLVARHLSSAEDLDDAMEAERKAGRGGKNQLLLSLLQNGIKESELRKVFCDECDLENAEARRQAWSRASKWAKNAGFYEVAQGIVILTKSRG